MWKPSLINDVWASKTFLWNQKIILTIVQKQRICTWSCSLRLNSFATFIYQRLSLRSVLCAQQLQKGCRLLGQMLHQHRAVFSHVLFCRLKIDPSKNWKMLIHRLYGGNLATRHECFRYSIFLCVFRSHAGPISEMWSNNYRDVTM